MSKRLLPFLFLIGAIVPATVFGQTFYPLPTDGTGKWHIESGSSGFMIPFYWYSGLHNDSAGTHDTIIGSFTYQKLYFSDQTPATNYIGSYRSEANGKSWFVPRDSVNEYLIMDLGAQPGDTLTNLLSCQNIGVLGGTTIPWSFVNYVVDSTGTFNSFNRPLKVIYGHDPVFTWNMEPEVWIESIGSLWGIFNCTHDGLNYDEVQCASSRDTSWLVASRPAPFGPPPIIFSFASSSCPFSFYTTTSLAENSEGAISLWPNPVGNWLHVGASHFNASNFYYVLDISGRIVLSGMLNEDGWIDVAELAPGNYILQLSAAESMLPVRFVKTDGE